MFQKLGKLLDDLRFRYGEVKEGSAAVNFGAHNLRKGEMVTRMMENWSAAIPPEFVDGDFGR